jgi:signal transduction histidine kinase
LPESSADTAITREIVARIDELSNLLKDMLLFSRPPQPRPAPVDVLRLIQTTSELFSADPALSQVSVQVMSEAAPIIHADAGLLKIVLTNLFANAAHALKGQGVIQVTLGESSGACLISVSDQGPGIPPEVREKIFTPFFTTKVRGTGLGLPTAKRLIEAHQGKIAVECPPGGGTTVRLQLPLNS